VRVLPLKPDHKRIAAYHRSLAEFEKLGVKHESANGWNWKKRRLKNGLSPETLAEIESAAKLL
jgi:hypothetical protein